MVYVPGMAEACMGMISSFPCPFPIASCVVYFTTVLPLARMMTGVPAGRSAAPMFFTPKCICRLSPAARAVRDSIEVSIAISGKVRSEINTQHVPIL